MVRANKIRISKYKSWYIIKRVGVYIHQKWLTVDIIGTKMSNINGGKCRMNHINVNHLVQFYDVLTEALEGGVLPLTLNGAFSKRILPLSVGQSSLSSLSAMNPFPKGNCTSTSLNSLPCSSTPGCLSASSSLRVRLPGDGFLSSLLTKLVPLAGCHMNSALAGTQYKTLHVFMPPCSHLLQHRPFPSSPIIFLKNVAADALSCPTQFYTWSSADLVSPELKPLIAYQIPAELLLHLLWLLSSPQIEHLLKKETSALLSPALRSLLLVAKSADFSTSLSHTPRKRRRVTSSWRLRKRQPRVIISKTQPSRTSKPFRVICGRLANLLSTQVVTTPVSYLGASILLASASMFHTLLVSLAHPRNGRCKSTTSVNPSVCISCKHFLIQSGHIMHPNFLCSPSSRMQLFSVLSPALVSLNTRRAKFHQVAVSRKFPATQLAG